MTDPDPTAGLFCCVHHLGSLRGRGGDGFFDEHMQTGGEALQRDLVMQVRRGQDVDGVTDLRRDQIGNRPKALRAERSGQPLRRTGRRIADRDHPDAGRCAQGIGVPVGDIPRADQTDAHFGPRWRRPFVFDDLHIRAVESPEVECEHPQQVGKFRQRQKHRMMRCLCRRLSGLCQSPPSTKPVEPPCPKCKR